MSIFSDLRSRSLERVTDKSSPILESQAVQEFACWVKSPLPSEYDVYLEFEEENFVRDLIIQVYGTWDSGIARLGTFDVNSQQEILSINFRKSFESAIFTDNKTLEVDTFFNERIIETLVFRVYLKDFYDDSVKPSKVTLLASSVESVYSLYNHLQTEYDLRQEDTKLQKELKEARKTIGEQVIKLSNKLEENNKLSEQLKEKENLIKELNESSQKTDSNQVLDLKRRIIEYTKEKTNLKEAIRENENKIKELENKISNSSATIKSQEEKITSSDSTIKKLNKLISDKDDKIKELNKALEDEVSEGELIQSLKQKIEKLESEILSLKESDKKDEDPREPIEPGETDEPNLEQWQEWVNSAVNSANKTDIKVGVYNKILRIPESFFASSITSRMDRFIARQAYPKYSDFGVGDFGKGLEVKQYDFIIFPVSFNRYKSRKWSNDLMIYSINPFFKDNTLNNKKYFTWFRVGNQNLNDTKYPDNGKIGIEYKIEWTPPETKEAIDKICDRSQGEWYKTDTSILSHQEDDRKYITYKQGEIEIAWVVLKMPEDLFIRTLWQLAFEIRAVDQEIIKKTDPELAKILLDSPNGKSERILQAESFDEINSNPDDSNPEFEKIEEILSPHSEPISPSKNDFETVEEVQENINDVSFEEMNDFEEENKNS